MTSPPPEYPPTHSAKGTPKVHSAHIRSSPLLGVPNAPCPPLSSKGWAMRFRGAKDVSLQHRAPRGHNPEPNSLTWVLSVGENESFRNHICVQGAAGSRGTVRVHSRSSPRPALDTPRDDSGLLETEETALHAHGAQNPNWSSLGL